MSASNTKSVFSKYLLKKEKDGKTVYYCNKCDKELLTIDNNGEANYSFYSYCKHFKLCHIFHYDPRHPDWIEECKSLGLISVKDKEGNTHFIIPRVSYIWKLKSNVYVWDLPPTIFPPPATVMLIRVSKVPMTIVTYGIKPVAIIPRNVKIKQALRIASKEFKKINMFDNVDDPFEYILRNLI